MTKTKNDEKVAVEQRHRDAAATHFQLNPTDFFDPQRLAQAFADFEASLRTPEPTGVERAVVNGAGQAVAAVPASVPSAGSVWRGTLLSVDFEEDELTFKISDMGKPIAAGRYAIVTEADFNRFVFRADLNAKKLAHLTADPSHAETPYD